MIRSKGLSGGSLFGIIVAAIIVAAIIVKGIFAYLDTPRDAPRFSPDTVSFKQSEAKGILKQIYIMEITYMQQMGVYWAPAAAADSIPANQNNLYSIGIIIPAHARYSYNITINGNNFLATATATGLDDDAPNDVWTMDQDGTLRCVSD